MVEVLQTISPNPPPQELYLVLIILVYVFCFLDNFDLCNLASKNSFYKKSNVFDKSVKSAPK